MGSIVVLLQDPDLSTLVLVSLEGQGHEVTVLRDSEAALARSSAGHDDLLLLDLDDHPPAGLGLARALHDGGRPTPPRVLMLTSRSSHQDVEVGRAAGVDEYVHKPFRVDDLVDRVDRLLATRSA